MVMYEIWSLGDKPFPHLTAQEASVSAHIHSHTLLCKTIQALGVLTCWWGLLGRFRHEKGVVL